MELFKEAEKLLASKGKGVKWAEAAVPVLCEVARETKAIEEKKKMEKEPYRESLAAIDEKYKGALDALSRIDSATRERVDKTYTGTEAIKVEGIGSIVFPETWGFEVTDMRQVDRKYLMINAGALRDDIRNGLRNIRGIEVKKVRGMQVRPVKEGE